MKTIFYSIPILIFLFTACNSPNQNVSGEANEITGEAKPDAVREDTVLENDFDDGEAEDTANNTAGEKLRIDQPDEDATISSPTTITGEAPGNWFFEGEFLVTLSQNGNELAAAIADAEGEWMTTEFVPFTATLEFGNAGEAGSALLLFEKSNPSGKPELDDTFEWPVKLAYD